MVAGVFGMICVFVGALEGLVFLIAEGLVLLLFTAGGVIMAVTIKGGKCGDVMFTGNNTVINCGGRVWPENKHVYYDTVCGLQGYKGEPDTDIPPEWVAKVKRSLQQRCEGATADYSLMFAMIILLAMALALGHVWRRKSKKGYLF
jgi:hypothetical protein